MGPDCFEGGDCVGEGVFRVTVKLIQVLVTFCDLIGLMTYIHPCIKEDEEVWFLYVQFNMEVWHLLFEEEQYCLHKLFFRSAYYI